MTKFNVSNKIIYEVFLIRKKCIFINLYTFYNSSLKKQKIKVKLELSSSKKY